MIKNIPDKLYKTENTMVELSYGTIPSFDSFLKHFIKYMNERSGKYTYELKGGDAETALRVGVPVEGSFFAVELYMVIQKLTKAWDEKGDTNAGDLASALLQTLEFRWV